MKKSYLVASLAGLTLIGLSSMPVSMVGATTEVVSDGQVMFKTDVTRTPAKNPLDPGDTKPGKPTNPTNPTGTATNGTTGPLSLDYASSFTFGEAMISADDAKYYAKPQVFSQDDGKTVDRPNFVQVTDKRGMFEGWTLKVKQEKQFSVKDDDTKELTGAQLKFLNGNVTSTIDQQYAPTGQKEITLVPGSAEVAPLAAAKDQGMGTWIYRFGDEQTMAKSIELAVPGTSPKMAKEYVTELTWTLESTPTNTTPSPKS
ncbi:WxL domain-containing protein [Lacticaseibacillus paracasei]|uniref:WxL domain-containing protein n=1 Tax=Lacticaseibacillus paracasei TaxID=1597 RepID=UPI0025A02516|nr:WxL domain-containing protein [Lacticaseibacillus paracasei]MDM7532506.1 WxL domain-containing protein [Lacticaseibacillus paracasei]